MELYLAPRNSLVRVIGDAPGPPDAPEVKPNEVVKFYHIDGMYSVCRNEQGQHVYLKAWQEVEVLNEIQP